MTRPSTPQQERPVNARPPVDVDEETLHEQQEEQIDEVGDASFPASDPPPWTLGVEPHGAH